MFNNDASQDLPLYIYCTMYRTWPAPNSIEHNKLFNEALAWLDAHDIEHCLPEHLGRLNIYGEKTIKFTREDDVLAFTLMYSKLLQHPVIHLKLKNRKI